MSEVQDKKVDLKMIITIFSPMAVLLFSIMPAILGVILAYEAGAERQPLMAFILVMIPGLMNGAVDLFNDYKDYVNGNDTCETAADETDAPLAYNRIKDPKPVLYAGIVSFAIAGVLGLIVILRCGILPGIIGLIGAVVALTYSGRFSTSHLPIGELLAGFTMGGLIPMGVYSALTGSFEPAIWIKTLPMMIAVAQIMLVNNTCDIEKDTKAGRHTLPMLTGRTTAQQIANIVSIFWYVYIISFLLLNYRIGFVVMAVFLVLTAGAYRATFTEERTPANKGSAILAEAKTALGVSFGYPVAVGVSLLLHMLLKG